MDKIAVDIRKHEVKVGRREVDLTPKEFELLIALSMASGALLTRDELVRNIWHLKDTDIQPDTRTVDQHIARLRKKIGHGAIKTVPSYGYKWAAS